MDWRCWVLKVFSCFRKADFKKLKKLQTRLRRSFSAGVSTSVLLKIEESCSMKGWECALFNVCQRESAFHPSILHGGVKARRTAK